MFPLLKFAHAFSYMKIKSFQEELLCLMERLNSTFKLEKWDFRPALPNLSITFTTESAGYAITVFSVLLFITFIQGLRSTI